MWSPNCLTELQCRVKEDITINTADAYILSSDLDAQHSLNPGMDYRHTTKNATM